MSISVLEPYPHRRALYRIRAFYRGVGVAQWLERGARE